MRECDARCVERLARAVARERGERRIVDVAPSWLAVLLVADDRPASRREVDAKLVPASCDEPAAEQRKACARRIERGDRFELREAPPPARRHDDATAIHGIESERRVDLAARRIHASVHNREVHLLARRRRERSLQRRVQFRGLRDDDDARGLLVETSDD